MTVSTPAVDVDVPPSYDASVPDALDCSAQTEASPLLPSKCAESHATLLEETHMIEIEDEESQTGFWGERAPFYDSETHSFWSSSSKPAKKRPRSLHDIICYWSATLMSLLTAFLLCWALITNFSEYEFAEQPAKMKADEHVAVASTLHELSFCLNDLNRQAPHTQTWRYLAPSVPYDCTTDIITLSADSANYWKIHSDDKIAWGSLQQVDNRDEEESRFLNVDNEIRKLELGDDPSGEGEARD
ncbi:hypothetical protein ACN47E_006469 [Coniothyrium glycines]